MPNPRTIAANASPNGNLPLNLITADLQVPRPQLVGKNGGIKAAGSRFPLLTQT